MLKVRIQCLAIHGVYFFFMIFVLSLGEDDDENDGMR